jgi:hypothetical protein
MLDVPQDFYKTYNDYSGKGYRNEVYQDVTQIGTPWSVVNDIVLSDSGYVATAFMGERNLSVLWRGNETVDLNKTPKGHFYPKGINDSSVIIGAARQDPDDFFNQIITYTTLLWRDGIFTELQSYKSDMAFNHAAINAFGTIVGTYSENGMFGYPDAVMWDGLQAYKLDNYVHSDTFFNLFSAEAINDSGSIACHASIGAKYSAVLLVPYRRIILPAKARFTITLIEASAKRISDIYIIAPDSVLLIENNLKNVGATIDTTYPAGTALEFTIGVHPPDSSEVYYHSSESNFARVEKESDSLWYIFFEDLPEEKADWDFDDVVLEVQLELLEPIVKAKPRLFHQQNFTIGKQAEIFDMRGRIIAKGLRAAKVNHASSGLYVLRRGNNTLEKRIEAIAR